MDRWRRFRLVPWFPVALLMLAVGCNRGPKRAPSPDAAAEAQSLALRVTHVDRRFVTRDHFIAAIEMQLSGEPFAQAMGRDLGGYSRDYTCQEDVCSPSLYVDPVAPPDDAGNPSGRVDLAGFSSAVESYEYSKQPMNNIAFESGAGDLDARRRRAGDGQRRHERSDRAARRGARSL